jgi:hypothetical protein
MEPPPRPRPLAASGRQYVPTIAFNRCYARAWAAILEIKTIDAWRALLLAATATTTVRRNPSIPPPTAPTAPARKASAPRSRLQMPETVRSKYVVRARGLPRRVASPNKMTDTTMRAAATTAGATFPRHPPRSPTPERPTASKPEASVAWYSPQQPEDGEVGASALVRVPQLRTAKSTSCTTGYRHPSLPIPARPAAPRKEATAVWLHLRRPEYFAKHAAAACSVRCQPPSPHGEGRLTRGQGHNAPLPAAPTAALSGSLGAEAQLRGWAPVRQVRRPLAAAPVRSSITAPSPSCLACALRSRLKATTIALCSHSVHAHAETACRADVAPSWALRVLEFAVTDGTPKESDVDRALLRSVSRGRRDAPGAASPTCTNSSDTPTPGRRAPVIGPTDSHRVVVGVPPCTAAHGHDAASGGAAATGAPLLMNSERTRRVAHDAADSDSRKTDMHDVFDVAARIFVPHHVLRARRRPHGRAATVRRNVNTIKALLTSVVDIPHCNTAYNCKHRHHEVRHPSPKCPFPPS